MTGGAAYKRKLLTDEAIEAMQSRHLKERCDPILLPEDRDIARVIARAPSLSPHLIPAAPLPAWR